MLEVLSSTPSSGIVLIFKKIFTQLPVDVKVQLGKKTINTNSHHELPEKCGFVAHPFEMFILKLILVNTNCDPLHSDTSIIPHGHICVPKQTSPKSEITSVQVDCLFPECPNFDGHFVHLVLE